MRAGPPPTSEGGKGFAHKEPPEPRSDWTIPEGAAPKYGEEKPAPQVRFQPPPKHPITRRGVAAARGLVTAAMYAPRPTPTPDLIGTANEIADTARAYESPAQMPGPSQPSIPPGGGLMPSPQVGPNYAAMSADANMGLFDMIRQSQAAPADAGEGESHEPYIHGED